MLFERFSPCSMISLKFFWNTLHFSVKFHMEHAESLDKAIEFLKKSGIKNR